MHKSWESAHRIQIPLDFLNELKENNCWNWRVNGNMRGQTWNTHRGKLYYLFIITKIAEGDSLQTFSFAPRTSVHRDLENKYTF